MVQGYGLAGLLPSRNGALLIRQAVKCGELGRVSWQGTGPDVIAQRHTYPCATY